MLSTLVFQAHKTPIWYKWQRKILSKHKEDIKLTILTHHQMKMKTSLRPTEDQIRLNQQWKNSALKIIQKTKIKHILLVSMKE